MLSVCYREFGGSDKLEIVNDFPMPEVGDSDVLIQLKSTSVNPVDWKIREGFLKSMLIVVVLIVRGDPGLWPLLKW